MADVTSQALDRFLAGVQGRALRMAQFATGSRDDALDVVQESMMTLVRKYAVRSTEDWGPLFHCILQSRINDYHRRRSVRDRFRRWLSFDDDESGERADPLDKVADENAPEPSARIDGLRAMEALDAALSSLPLRQQQAFLLRAWEGMDVKQAAAAMGCTEGSVKTHYFRALQVLRARLTEHAP